MKTGVQAEIFSHVRDYDYELVCGAVKESYPIEYEIPRENTGTLKNQGDIGACVAEVIAQIAESFYQEEMSEGYIYGEFRPDNMKRTTGGGMVVSSAMDFWRTIGTVPKKYFNILKEMPEMSMITSKFDDLYGIASRHKISSYATINYGDSTKKDNAIKDALMKYNRGLVCVAKSYFGESHCILLTGWNDVKKTYKFKNSWGESYGDNGFSEIPKNEVGICYLPLFEELTLPFTDVTSDKWFYNDVKSVYFTGLMQGVSEDTFAPDKPLTRAEMAAILHRITKMYDERFDILNRVLDEKIKG